MGCDVCLGSSSLMTTPTQQVWLCLRKQKDQRARFTASSTSLMLAIPYPKRRPIETTVRCCSNRSAGCRVPPAGPLVRKSPMGFAHPSLRGEQGVDNVVWANGRQQRWHHPSDDNGFKHKTLRL